LPLAGAQVTVTDILGASSQADPAALPVGAAPVFVSAGTVAPAEPTAAPTTAPTPTLPAPPTIAPTAAPPVAPGTLETHVVTVDGVQRTYHLYVPGSLPAGRPAPLVLVFHPRGKDGAGPAFAEKTGFPQLADKEGFIVVFPDGINSKWMDGDPNIDPVYNNDLPFVEAILGEVGNAHPIDPQRIYATGHSNGAAFSQFLAMHLPDRIAAIGSSGAGLAETWLDDLAAARTFSIIISCGSKDPYCDRPVDAAGNLQFPYLMRLQPTWDAFVQHNGCNAEGQESLLPDLDPADRCRVTRIDATGCQAGTAVEVLWADGAGHDWYHSGQGSTTQCRDIDDTRLFWEFFKSHPKP
jgi:polyhydroxybutyrate depolymerase